MDARLDLGGVSDRVRAERLDRVFSDDQVEEIINTNNSPNLLVDPETMSIACIDFDQGQWNEGMTEAKALAFEIAEHRRDLIIPQALGTTALH